MHPGRGAIAGRWKIEEFTGREVMDLPPETPLKNFSYILAAGMLKGNT